MHQRNRAQSAGSDLSTPACKLSSALDSCRPAPTFCLPSRGFACTWRSSAGSSSSGRSSLPPTDGLAAPEAGAAPAAAAQLNRSRGYKHGSSANQHAERCLAATAGTGNSPWNTSATHASWMLACGGGILGSGGRRRHCCCRLCRSRILWHPHPQARQQHLRSQRAQQRDIALQHMRRHHVLE